jgi:hypothetical protein
MTGRIIDFIKFEHPGSSNEFRDMSDLKFIENKEVDIGFSSPLDKKNLSYFEELCMKKEDQKIAKSPPRYTYLYQTFSFLIRSASIKSEPVESSIDDINYVGFSQGEIDLLNENYEADYIN